MLTVGGKGRISEQRAQHPVLGHHDEPVELVVDDPDGVELEEALGHHERGLARLAHRPMPAARRASRVAPPLVIGVEPALRLKSRQHELVGAEERQELLPVPPHVLPALGDLDRVTEDEVRFPGGHVDREPGHLPPVGQRIAGLRASGEPGRVVWCEREQGSGEKPAAGDRRVKAVDAVLQVVDQAECDGGGAPAGSRSAPPRLEDAANVVACPVAYQVPGGASEPPRGSDEPVRRVKAPGLRERLSHLDGCRDLLWTHG